ncbi:hypothetical protein [Actinomadura alba]|uniref:Uncharacterized protein n=1 Tax=Actinomadura alba TaxID=406431 RepID=A0ABR7LHG6_9ACTN|nr:hypothetical protein [Actinomadura alba]MBC6464256.1 hypothetical protein [Actinomadura alba]
MGTFAFKDLVTLVGGYDFTTDLREASLDAPMDALEGTAFGSSARSRRAGFEDVEASLSGWWQAGTGLVDEQAFNTLTGVRAVTQVPLGTEGSTAFLYQARSFTYTVGGDIGELLPFELAMQGGKGNGNPGLIRGMYAKARGSVSATGAIGSAVNLGAPIAGQYVYATLHVLAAGTTITVQVQSDDSAGFASPTTRATIGPITAAGGTWMTRVAGPFAGETHWRFNVSAVTGTFAVAGAIGIK